MPLFLHAAAANAAVSVPPVSGARRAAVLGAGGAAVGAVLSPVGLARADAAFPARPVKLVVPFPPGGPIDYLARSLAAKAGQESAWRFVVENQVGASGLVAARSVARAPADGYQLLYTDAQILVLQSLLKPDAGVDALADFVPIAGTCDMVQVLVARKSLPVGSLAELVELARRNPGRLTYASAGATTVSALMMGAVAKHHGLDMTHVPLKGNSEIILELLAERLDVAFVLAQSLVGQPFRRIAVAADRQVAQLPDVAPLPPLLGERNDFMSAFSLLAPRGTPPEVVALLSDTANRHLGASSSVAELTGRGFLPNFSSGPQLRRRIEGLSAMWASFLRTLGVSA